MKGMVACSLFAWICSAGLLATLTELSSHISRALCVVDFEAGGTSGDSAVPRSPDASYVSTSPRSPLGEMSSSTESRPKVASALGSLFAPSDVLKQKFMKFVNSFQKPSAMHPSSLEDVEDPTAQQLSRSMSFAMMRPQTLSEGPLPPGWGYILSCPVRPEEYQKVRRLLFYQWGCLPEEILRIGLRVTVVCRG